MTSNHSVTLATTREGSAAPCPCGCSGGPDTACKLECTVRPRFFCGQLLTDQDLEALAGWTRQRLALSRYRDGWGVVCGLEVRCDPDPRQPARVLVSRGYAVSCCGDDVVLCEETGLDLREVCREDKDPCADLRRHLPEQEAHPERAVDLYLRYREVPSEPQTALGRSACKEASVCEFSRVREGGELIFRPAVHGGDPRQEEADRWEAEYRRCEEVSEAFFRQFGQVDFRDPARIRRWLLDWISGHPLHQFCFVRDWICGLSQEEIVRDEHLAPILYWLIQDCRNAFLQCGCHACADDVGVPLARVCLRAGTDRVCWIVSIDPYPPYRRLLSSECWPAAPGKVNLGPLIWRREEEVCAALADLGVEVESRRAFTPPTLLRRRFKRLSGPMVVSCHEKVCLQVFAPPEGSCLSSAGRVVGFLCLDEEPPPPFDVTAVKDGPGEVRTDEEILYSLAVRVHNPLPTEIEVSVEDLLPEPLVFLPGSSNPAPAVQGQLLRWVLGTVSPRSDSPRWTLTFKVKLSHPVEKVINSFQVIGRGPQDAGAFSHPSNPVTTLVRSSQVSGDPGKSGTPPAPQPTSPRKKGKA